MKAISLPLIGILTFQMIGNFPINVAAQKYGGLSEDKHDLVFSEENVTGNTKFGSKVANAGDLNGDGFDDIIVCSIGDIYIYFGGTNADTIPDIIINGESTNLSFGDINGDGYGDLAIAGGKVSVYLGGENMDGIADIILENFVYNRGFSSGLSCSGDINKDGFDDLIVGAECRWNEIGKVYIYFGGDTIDTFPNIILEGTLDRRGYFGSSISSTGDLNNDSYDDVIVKESMSLFVYFGGVEMDSIPDLFLIGQSTSSSGDINNDGFDDIITRISGYNEYPDRVFIYYGGHNMDSIVDITIHGIIEYDMFGYGTSISGDFNNDGVDDFILGGLHRGSELTTERVYIYYGSDNPDTIPDVILEGGRISGNNDFSLSSAGDFNKDGFSDIIIGEPYWNLEQGKACIYYGGYTFDSIADIVLYGKTTNNQFGFSVSSAGDINNDNFDDILVSAYGYTSEEYAGRVFVYYGGIEMDTIADKILNSPENGRHGRCVASAGDVNNDGYDDILISGGGNIYIYLGDTLLKDTPDIILTETAPDYGISASSAGDVNGDGYDDVIVGSKVREYQVGGIAYIYFGGEYMNSQADLYLEGDYQNINYFGSSVSSASDVNNDGYDDVIVGAPVFSSYGRAYIYFGHQTMDNTPDVVLQGRSQYQHFGNSVASAGDVNGDSFDDVIIGTNRSISYIFYGGITMDHNPNVNIINKKSNGPNIVSSAGDVNGDGIDDVIIGHYSQNSYMGQSIICYGGENMDDTTDITLDGENTGDYFGYSVASAGDVNSDGLSDIIVGAYGYDYKNGRVYLYFGEIPIIINQQPNDIQVCEGDTACFSIVATNAIHYQWQVSIDSGTTFININDNTIYSGSLTSTLNLVSNGALNRYCYRCKVDNNYQTRYSQSTTLEVNPLPEIRLIGDTAFCERNSIDLNANFIGTPPWSFIIYDGADSIVLNTNDSQYSLPIDSVGTYKILFVNDLYCSNSNLINNHFSINRLPSSTLSGGENICDGDSTNLNIVFTGEAPWTFDLSDGNHTKKITTSNNPFFVELDSAGIYSVVSLNDANCIGANISGEAKVKILSRPTSFMCGNTSVCLHDSNEICILFTGMKPWFFSLSDGLKNTDYKVFDNPYSLMIDSIGIYKIIELHDANCTGIEMSGQVELKNCTSSDLIETEDYIIFPNPTNGKITIKNLLVGTKIIITSISGQIIYSNMINSKIIDINLNSSGIYFISLIHDNKLHTGKIIVK